MATAEKLNYLIETKNQIGKAIKEKGVSVTDTDSFRSYANKISQIEGSEGTTGSNTDEWQPEADWWDIEKILEEDTEDYAQKIICLLTDELDDGATTNTVKGGEKYKLSDGQIIEQSASTDLDITTLFDTTQDKECSKGYKTRYIIYYSNASSMNITLPNNVIYTIFSGVVYNARIFSSKKVLQAVKFINSNYTNTNADLMFNGCYLLQSVSGLNTEEVTNMRSMFSSCYSLRSIPTLNTSKVTNMSSMFSSCYSLKSITELNTSKVTDMSSMFSFCRSLQRISNLDTSEVTNMGSMFNSCSVLNIANLNMSKVSNASYIFYDCSSLFNIKNIKNINTDIAINNSTYLNRTTLLKIINALVDLTGQTTKTLTLGSINLAKLTDEEKAIATNKNWTLA